MKPLLCPPLDRGGMCLAPCPVKGKGGDRVWFETMFWLGVGCLGIIMYKFIVKEGLIYQINQLLPPKEAGLLSGMVWGEKNGFSKSFYEQLQITGLVHVVVASGTNVMIISRLIIENLAYILSRKRAIIIGMGLIWWYAVMVGLDPPIVRASGLMTIFYGAQMLGRKFDLMRALILVVGVMVLADYRVLGSVSFWLSMGAFIGVVTTPKIPNSKLQVTINTIWISLWVTPILAVTFGKISIVGPLVNALVLGLVEGVTVVGMAGMVVQPLLWLVYPMLHYIVVLVETVAKFPMAMVEIRFNWWLVAGWYLILVYFLIKKSSVE